MSLRDELAQRARPYLEPGEQIQAVFMGQSGVSPYWNQLIGVLVLIPFVMVYVFKLQSTAVGVVLTLILGATIVTFSTLFIHTHH